MFLHARDRTMGLTTSEHDLLTTLCLYYSLLLRRIAIVVATRYDCSLHSRDLAKPWQSSGSRNKYHSSKAAFMLDAGRDPLLSFLKYAVRHSPAASAEGLSLAQLKHVAKYYLGRTTAWIQKHLNPSAIETALFAKGTRNTDMRNGGDRHLALRIPPLDRLISSRTGLWMAGGWPQGQHTEGVMIVPVGRVVTSPRRRHDGPRDVATWIRS